MLSEKEIISKYGPWFAVEGSSLITPLYDTCLALFTLIEDVKAALDYATPGMRLAGIERLLKDWEGKVNA
jgi:hypothetical protein